MAADIVPAEIMIVPGSHNGCILHERLVARLATELIVLGLQGIHVFGVTVNVIAEKNKIIGLMLQHLVENQQGIILVGTGTESDAGLLPEKQECG